MIVGSGYRKHGFDAHSGKILRKEDMSYWMNKEERTDPRGIALGLAAEVEEVEPDFFDLLPTVSEVWIQNPDCRIYMTEKTVRLFQSNRVLLRGAYDTAAEKLARGYHLRFLHLDVELASVGDYFEHGNDLITLCFRDGGSAYIHQDSRCQGISAGNTGGGELSFDLPDDFYLTMKPSEIADMCWARCRKEMLSNGKLSAFMKKAKNKKGFLLDFTES